MGDKTGISWTDATWNPVLGCTHVSAGCDHCYAAREASGRLAHLPAYAGLAEGGRFTGKVRLMPERLDQPLRWHKPRRIFVNSMSDLFHDQVPDEFIAQVFAMMLRANWHIFQVLTKRPGRMASLLNSEQFPYLVADAIDRDSRQRGEDVGVRLMYRVRLTGGSAWPLSNVWLGTSVEDQKWADVRIPQLLRTPAAVRFLSCEPLLGRVSLVKWFFGRPVAGHCADIDGYTWHQEGQRCEKCRHGMPKPDWVIVGGESGPGARPMQLDWARTLRDQCEDAGVAFHFKQWGGRTPKSGGRLLDGRTWDQYPQQVPA
jgi:protein gp37